MSDEARTGRPDANGARGSRPGLEEKRLQGHRLLTRMGKRTLRPSGTELTRRIIKAARPAKEDKIVELGSGMGRTAEILLTTELKEHIGVDPNKEGTQQLLETILKRGQVRLQQTDAKNAGLPDGSVNLVVGGAMLMMQPDGDKLAIVRGAFQVLAPKGRYAIYELGFCPDDVSEDAVHDVSCVLLRTIKVGARPLVATGWKRLLEEVGLQVEYANANPVVLLEAKRLVADEGFFGALQFFFDIIRNKAARGRTKAMQGVLRARRENIGTAGFVAHKP